MVEINKPDGFKGIFVLPEIAKDYIGSKSNLENMLEEIIQHYDGKVKLTSDFFVKYNLDTIAGHIVNMNVMLGELIGLTGEYTSGSYCHDEITGGIHWEKGMGCRKPKRIVPAHETKDYLYHIRNTYYEGRPNVIEYDGNISVTGEVDQYKEAGHIFNKAVPDIDYIDMCGSLFYTIAYHKKSRPFECKLFPEPETDKASFNYLGFKNHNGLFVFIPSTVTYLDLINYKPSTRKILLSFIVDELVVYGKAFTERSIFTKLLYNCAFNSLDVTAA